MPDLQFHFLNARADLRDIEAWSLPLLRETHALATARLKLRPLDIVIRPGKRVVPQKGHVGHATEPGVIFLTLDLENPALRANPDRSLERMFAHELHHAARWDGPGYGRTLGAALVSEGLAGQFAQELFGGPPEPWESLDPSACLPFRDRALRDWSDIRYNHAG